MFHGDMLQKTSGNFDGLNNGCREKRPNVDNGRRKCPMSLTIRTPDLARKCPRFSDNFDGAVDNV